MSDPKSHAHDSHGVSATELRERLEAAEANVELMRWAMIEFVDRVDRGEVRSKKTYAKFKNILANIADQRRSMP